MLPCNGSWKLDLSTSNDEINDLNIALERIKELEHEVAQNAAKLDAANKTNYWVTYTGTKLNRFPTFSWSIYVDWLWKSLTCSLNWSNHTYTWFLSQIRKVWRLVYFQRTVVIEPYNMSPWITFEVYGLHNGYIRDECPKNFQWLGNFLATSVFKD